MTPRPTLITTILALILMTTPAASGAANPKAAKGVAAARFADGGHDPFFEALARGELERFPAPVFDAGGNPPAVRRGYALTQDQMTRFDITDTPAAKAELRRFIARNRERQGFTAAPAWTVYALPSIAGTPVGPPDGDDGPLDSVLIVPAGTAVELVGAVFHDGRLQAKTVLSAEADDSETDHPARPMAAPSDSARWTPAGGLYCVDRKQNRTAIYDPCQRFYRMDNDGDPNHVYWGSQMDGTAVSKPGWRLMGFDLDQRRTGGTAAQDWIDWSPGADTEGNCQPVTVGVAYAGASLSVTKNQCEVWNISKGEDFYAIPSW